MIDPSADRAVFRQLADLLRDRITSGDLAPGASLPSELRLAQEYGLSRTSVRQAVALLRSEGLVIVEPPRGTFVRAVEPTETVALLKGDTAAARMPTPVERRELEMGEGIPVIVIFRADGSRELYAADRIRVGR
ncbi:winged helix-turn-helix domain-containing protein [Micromonospora sp. BRA006-A]|uniref:winged helix-turn-helix domain-containing protein n=1 Tax=Micromonospora sp. BRA006-A TaxID=2962860 RepID=UPI00296E5E41|nr:winged helix-turn-helix domain-containing protein [Micromonospora sp. BRA006-A]MDW3845253.1 winged helix-turn-helix domain-containing protein [Micromonospora sp. BRA006-A]MEE3919221.1 winged helix-turn-helix domain-containing protein [Micromonospora sp. BRA006-A]